MGDRRMDGSTGADGELGIVLRGAGGRGWGWGPRGRAGGGREPQA